MRTTLDIDDDVLQAAKERAKVEKKTTGQALSDLARMALTGSADHGQPVIKDGWVLLPRTGAVVTSELVQDLLDQADLADAGPGEGK